MEHKIDTVKTVRYVSKNFTTSLTDVTLNVRMPSGTLFDFGTGTNLVLTAISNGEYEGTYTPNALGTWQELITSTTNGDKGVRSYEVVEVDLDTLDGKLDSLGLSIAPGGYFSN